MTPSSRHLINDRECPAEAAHPKQGASLWSMLLGFCKCQPHTCCQSCLCWAGLIESTLLAVIRETPKGEVLLWSAWKGSSSHPVMSTRCVRVLRERGGRTLHSSRVWKSCLPVWKAGPFLLFLLLIPGWWLSSLIGVYSSSWFSVQSSWSKDCAFS